MTEEHYSQADLYEEAARQYKDLTEDHDFSCVAEGMRSREPWDSLGDDDFGKAHHEVDRLLGSAADVSRWAVELGADGLVPDRHSVDYGRHPEKAGPLLRLHFAFDSEVDSEGRHDLVSFIAEHVSMALKSILSADQEESDG